MHPWEPERSAEPGVEAGLAQPDLLAEGEELVAGRRPVEEAFAARRDALRLLVVPQRRQALDRLVLHATSLRIPIVEVEGGTLTAVAGFDGHQGIALVTKPRRFVSVDDILARALERGEPPFVLVLDSLEDPQNLGTLLRSAEAAGIHGVVFPTKRQAPLSPAAVKASAGAVEHLLLAPVDDLGAAITDLHVRGLRVVGAEAEAPMTARQADLRGPLAVVVGSEGQGLGPAVRRRCDQMVRIPMRGAVASLNAAVAGSVLLYEAASQRDQDEGQPQPATEAPAAPLEAGDGDEAGTAPPRRTRPRATGTSGTARRKRRADQEPEVPVEPSPVEPSDHAEASDAELLPGLRITQSRTPAEVDEIIDAPAEDRGDEDPDAPPVHTDEPSV